ncbi:MAG: Flp pilus assembly protein CpaB [Actinobacteria bacterium]|nr:MAG: Flp pilus assembly protein CpaB [Actinomycetota bacterium]
MRSKILIVVAALVLGGVAAVVAAQYLRSARTDIAAMNEPVAVLVAQQDLPRGVSAEELIAKKLVAEEKVPRQWVAADAVSSARLVANQVLAVPVGKGELLTKSRFQYPSEAGLSYSVPQDLVALSVDVDDVKGVAGLLKPGDNVVVYATFKPDGQAKTAYTQTVVGKAKVLAVGAAVTAEQTNAGADEQKDSGGLLNSRSGGTAGEELTYRTVTLGLSVEDGERVAFAREIGEVHLALLAQNAQEPKKPAPVWFKGPVYTPFAQIVK